MKKIKFLIVFLLLYSPLIHVSAKLQTVIMGRQYNDPKEELEPLKRLPISPIYVNQDGHPKKHLWRGRTPALSRQLGLLCNS